MFMYDMSERHRRELILMIDILNMLGVFNSREHFSNALEGVYQIFQKYGHYENYS